MMNSPNGRDNLDKTLPETCQRIIVFEDNMNLIKKQRVLGQVLDALLAFGFVHFTAMAYMDD
jgi:hypothetical protein